MSIYEPPPGFRDIDGDAEDAPPLGPARPLEIPRLGVVVAHKPKPRSIAALANAANRKLGAVEQGERFNEFVVAHLAEGEFDRIVLGMMAGDFPSGAIGRIAKAVAVWGTARPYGAVLALAVITAQHWRVLRGKLLAAGVADPMGLPSMHHVLDFTELTVLETMGGGDAKKAERERTAFWNGLYAPDRDEIEEAKAAGDSGHRPPPSGFDPEDMEAAFDAFAKIAR